MLVKEVNMLNFEAFVNHSRRMVEQRVGNMSLHAVQGRSLSGLTHLGVISIYITSEAVNLGDITKESTEAKEQLPRV